MREFLKRSMSVKSSRIRFLEAWARKLPTRDPEEVAHAVEVFAEVRFRVSKRTARKYAREILRLLSLDLNEEDRSAHSLTKYLEGE